MSNNNINEQDTVNSNINTVENKSKSTFQEIKESWNGEDLSEEKRTPRNILFSRIALVSYLLTIILLFKDIWHVFANSFNLKELIFLAIKLEFYGFIIELALTIIILTCIKISGTSKYNRAVGEKVNIRKIIMTIISILIIIGYMNMPLNFSADVEGVYYLEDDNKQFACVHIPFKNISSEPVKISDCISIELKQNGEKLELYNKNSLSNQEYDLKLLNRFAKANKGDTIDIYLLYELEDVTSPIDMRIERKSDCLGIDIDRFRIHWDD